MADFPFMGHRIAIDSFRRSEWTEVDVERSRAGGRLATDLLAGVIGWDLVVKAVGDTERAVLEAHYTSTRGRREAFDFPCPIDGVTRLVEYDQDRLDGELVGPSVYHYPIRLVTA